jgi:hypothetical protein
MNSTPPFYIKYVKLFQISHPTIADGGRGSRVASYLLFMEAAILRIQRMLFMTACIGRNFIFWISVGVVLHGLASGEIILLPSPIQRNLAKF